MSRSPESPVGPALLAAIGAISAATLAVQVLQTRLFSVMLWHHLTYMVVTVTLLGFAAGGSLLAVAPRIGRLLGDPRAAVSLCCSLFGLTLVLAFAVLSHTELDTLDIERDRTKYFYLFLHYAYLVVPFVCAGLSIAIALQQYPSSVHRTYFWNLIGSGAGPFIFLLAIRDCGGTGTLYLCASLAGVAGLLATTGYRGSRSWLPRGLAILTALIWPLSLAAPALTDSWIPITPARSKAQTVFESFQAVAIEHYRKLDPDYPLPDERLQVTRWAPFCRLDTLPQVQLPGDVQKDRENPAASPRGQVHVFQDGDAPTVIWSGSYAAERPYEKHFYGLGYQLVSDPRVLIIGPGGGNDVETALHYGATEVTAVDINGDTLEMVRTEPFASYTNRVYERPRVRAVNSEGRSFLRREGGTYDLLQMSGTDTYAALSSGSYIFSESYLYTEEAFDDFFAHMADRGVISIIRFRFEPPRETLKLVATAARALRRLGVEDPSAHFIVVNQEDRQAIDLAQAIQTQITEPELLEKLRPFRENFTSPLRYSFTLMRKTPFTRDEVDRIRGALSPMDSPSVSHWLYYGAGYEGVDTEYGALLTAMAAGPDAETRFHADYPYNTEPATDDRPFFFNFHSFADVSLFGASDAGYEALTGSEPIGLYILAALLIQTGIATLLLVIIPLVRLGFSAPPGRSRSRVLIYFLALGLAYLLVEITTIQRFVLYLGHPTYSLSAGLVCFLVFSGFGSAWAGKRGGGERLAARSAVVVVGLLLVHALVLPPVLRATLAFGETARVAMTVVWIAPLAFAMGIPFPTGLRQLRAEAAGVIPWAFGVNGAASVMASILSIVVAMQAGFTTVFLAAAGLYLLASFTVPRN